MDYDWGSRVAIAELLGGPVPSPRPQAELWIGAHASAPSLVEDESGSCSLADWIAEAPQARLGPGVVASLGDRLPFLLKVLAAEIPLSLQAHPSLEQARAGYAREEAHGVHWSAPERNYKDPDPKPEILCALGSFDALCGFRLPAAMRELLERLSVPGLAPVISALDRHPGPHGVEEAFAWLLGLAPASACDLVGEVAKACRRLSFEEGPDRAALAWACRLAQLHPADSGVVASLMLNHVRLSSGQAMFLPAGTLHSYLGGCGIELMASSDNVLRGGLTTKRVDVAELLSVLNYESREVESVPTLDLGSGETAYLTDTPYFRLARIESTEGGCCRPERRGPELLLCTSGRAEIATGRGPSMPLARGQSAFFAAEDGDYIISGEAQLFRATVGDGVV